MRRRQVQYLQAQQERHTVLFVAAGAVAGAAAGMFLGRRYRTVDAFLEDMRARIDDLRLAWDEEADEDRGFLASVVDRVDEVLDDVDVDDDDQDADEDEDQDDWVDSEPDDVDANLDDDLVDDEEDELDEDDLDADIDEVVSANGTDRGIAAMHAQLEDDVLQALHDDRRLRSRAIEIAVVGDGVVELTGSVHTIDEISRAAAVVRKVRGVAMVLNRIEVRAAGHVDTASVPREPVKPDPSDEAGPTPA
jgi:hypothetical protein